MVLRPGAPEGSPAVVLILKRLRRPGHGLKSYQTDWEKPVEPASPGLQVNRIRVDILASDR